MSHSSLVSHDKLICESPLQSELNEIIAILTYGGIIHLAKGHSYELEWSAMQSKYRGVPMAMMKEEIHFASIDIEDKMTWEEEGKEKSENNACHILPWFMCATLQMKQFDVNLLDMENIEWLFPGQGLQIWCPLRQQIHQYLDKISLMPSMSGFS